MAKKEPAKGTAKITKKAPAKGANLCACPYCETEVETKGKATICQPCGVTLLRCASCLTVLETGAKACHKCGKPVKK
ncbi:MAG: hypothetical protein Q7T05_06300 [Dehalococcoidia bacterium]|nr:hypothetical protein [Dehalococcoidia bacterium]